MSSRKPSRQHRFLLLLLVCAGCAVHPRGERDERDRADDAMEELGDEAERVDIPEPATLDDWLRAAFHGNARLRARYWEWRAALERIPQEASPPRAAIEFSYLFSSEQMNSWDRTTLGVRNDPMENIPWPSKLAISGRRALEEARAAGLRFEAEKFAVQAEVRNLYADLALHSVQLDVQKERVGLLALAAGEKSAGVSSGRTGSEQLLDANTASVLARNDLENLHAQMQPLFARMNAIVGRDARAPVALPESLPAPRPLTADDTELLALAAERSPELGALAHEVAGREEALELARAQWFPDFGLGLSFMGGVSQTIGGMVVLPTNVEAIQAGIREAEARLHAARSMREQYARDLAASFVLDLYVLRNAERQAEFFEKTVIPRIEALAQTSQASYAAGRGTLGGYVEVRMALLDAKLTVAELRTEREKTLAAIESFSKVDVEALHPVRMGSGMR